jgi:hypothetical protein
MRSLPRPAMPSTRYLRHPPVRVERCTRIDVATYPTSPPSGAARTASRRCSTSDKTTGAIPSLLGSDASRRGRAAQSGRNRTLCRSADGRLSRISRRRTGDCRCFAEFVSSRSSRRLRRPAHGPGGGASAPSSAEAHVGSVVSVFGLGIVAALVNNLKRGREVRLGNEFVAVEN